MVICENTHVKVIKGPNTGETGKVISVYPDIDTAVISFDKTGDVGKVSISVLVEVEEPKKEEKEIPKGFKLITRNEYDAALVDAVLSNNIIKDTKNVFSLLAGMIVGRKMGDSIFNDNDEILISKDKFVSLAWASCSPEKVSGYVDNDMSVSKCFTISLASIPTIHGLIKNLFGADEC